ncbi:hypothetical protein JNUCC0626_13460 [Lentzea sp. JNUCC 0626]|uniref:hypothetical protein n=1 Tax=Lentzea sp. JNUCC 0626 TaxID=3367513 RepID=UPI003748BA6F
MLTAVGVHPDQVSEDVEARAWLWRTVLAEHGGAGQRVLVVVDNVSSADQVLPLLPGDSEQGHRVQITSRHRLAGLPGTRLVTLPTLREAGREVAEKAGLVLPALGRKLYVHESRFRYKDRDHHRVDHVLFCRITDTAPKVALKPTENEKPA